MTSTQISSVLPLSSKPGVARAFLIAIRPPTLLAGLGPVLIGISFGIHQGTAPTTTVVFSSLVALFLVVFLQAAANLVNDVKDAEKGIDSGERLGPIRTVQSGLLSVQAVKRSYRLLFALAATLVLAIAIQRKDGLIPVVALACGLTAYLYTGGPFPLAYYAMGELLACGFFGPIAVMGTAYLITGRIHWDTAFWGLGSGFIAAAIMAINNLRDRSGDALAGKHTLATLWGEDLARKLPLLLVLGSTMLIALFGFKFHKSIIAVPWALLAMIFIRRRITPRLMGEGPILNEALRFTALFNIFYALLFSTLVLL